MLTYRDVRLHQFEILKSISVSQSYFLYPNIYQAELIPNHIFQILNNHWSSTLYKIENIIICRLENVFVVEEGLVFTKDGRFVIETQTGHSDEVVLNAKKSVQNIIDSNQKIRSHSKAVLCKQRGCDNYGHWIIEMLPKAYLARRELKVDDWSIAVHKTSDNLQSIMEQSLTVIGVDPSRITITSNEPTFFDELIVIHGLTAHSIFISSPVFECMEFISSQVGLGSADKVYAVRRPARSRDFEDEPEAGAVFHSHGFREVETAALSFREQVLAFKNAKRVVGPMGAALTNIIFCRPGTEIIVFMPATALELLFWLISEGKKLCYHEIRCDEVGELQGALPWDRAIRILPEVIDKTINLIHLKQCLRINSSIENSFNVEPLISRERLCFNDWGWHLNMNMESDVRVRFLPTGKISGHTHENEAYWEINDGILEIYSTYGICSWKFDSVIQKDNKLHMRSRFLLDAGYNVLLLIENY
jgi:capsular polysaccharide biosynthesis protein